MKKLITMIAVAAVAAVATADITSFSYAGGNLFDKDDVMVLGGTLANPADPIVDGAVIQLVDLSAFVSGGQINIADIPAAYTSVDISLKPVGLGSAYGTLAITEDPSTVVDTPLWLVVDLNGGGIALGDFIGLAASSDSPSALTPPVGAGDVETFSPGNITANIEVIPEPATIGLMGLAGLGMFLARRKVRR